MSRSIKRVLKLAIFLSVCLGCAMAVKAPAYAANQTVTVIGNEELEVVLNVGDSGTIVPNSNLSHEICGVDSNGNIIYETVSREPAVWYTYEFWDQSWNPDNHCITLYEDGSFAATGFGTEYVEITGYDSYGTPSFYAEVSFSIQMDMSNVTLATSSINGYLFAEYDDGTNVHYGCSKIDIAVNSPIVLNEWMEGINLTCETSNPNVWAYATLNNNVLGLELYAQEKSKTALTITMGGKVFTISASLQPVRISTASLLLEKGHSKQLKLKGCSENIQWSSSNPKIASVSKQGVVKGKQIGNVVITAKMGEQRIGCAVSVTTGSIKKVCARATYIGTHWTYSQATRAQSGYYDCSSLVWKAYHQYTNINFGSSTYPGTSKAEAAWCKNKGKMIKGGYSYEKVQKMQLNPGDIVFKSTDSKDPYNSTYHVEMFTGYICVGYDSEGNPIVNSVWAARGVGYEVEEGSLLARPMK